MAGPLARLYATLGLDTTGFDKGVKGAEKKAKGFGSQVGSGIGAGLGIGIGLGVADIAATGVSAIVSGFGDAIDAASQFEEANSKVGVVFDSMAEDVREFASTSATSMGLASGAALDALGTFGNFTQALGLTEAASVSMSKSMVQLAADIGSFNNVASDEVLLALRSGLSGEAEPMRRFGVALSETAVSARLTAQGIEKVNGKFTEAQKVTARYQLIMEQTTKAQGDFARTSDGLANKQRILDATLTNLQTDMGRLLLPIVTDATSLFADFAKMLAGPSSASEAMTTFTDRIYGVRPAMEDAAAATGEWKDGLGSLEDIISGTPLELLMPGAADEIDLWRQYGEQLSKTGLSFGDFVANMHHSQRDLGLSREAALDAALAWAEYGKGVNAAFDSVKSITMAAGQSLFPTITAPPLRIYGAVNELAGKVEFAISEATKKLKAPFATFHKEAPEEVEQTFADIRAEIKAGFGSVKEALRGGDRTIDPATRMRNMHNRLTQASRELAQAVEVGDPFGIAYWEAAVAKQRVNLRQYRQNTRDTQRDVVQDARRKVGDFADVGREQGEAQGNAYRRALVRSMERAVTNVIQTIGQSMAVQIINFGNVYGGPAGERELQNRLTRAERLARRDRG